MKSNSQVQATLQSAITVLLELSARYHLYHLDVSRFGLALAEKLDTLGEQCEAQIKCLSKSLFLLDGQPIFNPPPVAPESDIQVMLQKLYDAENALDDSCAEWAKTCWDAGDMTNFHFFQHLSKWHRKGDNGFKGHLCWLRKKLWQLRRIGLDAFIEVQISK